jgi:FimV-like protein
MVTVSSPGAAAAGTNTGADGTAGASAADSAGSNRFVVKPGQSLNDIASAVIQSNDRAMRDRMVALLFKANPGAFMGRDPDRLKIGAVIQVPDGAIQRAPQPSNTATGMSGAPLPTLASHAAALDSAAPGIATSGGVASSGASVGVTLGVTSGASTPSAPQAEGVPVHQASTPATAGVAAIVPESGSVALASPSASAAWVVSTTAVAASQGTARASARTGASPRLSPTIAAGAAALAFLLVGLLIALVRRRQRAAATGNMGGAQGVGPREETRAGAARAPDGGLPHRASAMRTGSESSDGTVPHAGDEALQAAVVGTAATGVAAAAMGVAATAVAAAVTRDAGRGGDATSDAESPVVSGSSDAIDSERAQERAHVVPVAHEDVGDRDDESLLASHRGGDKALASDRLDAGQTHAADTAREGPTVEAFTATTHADERHTPLAPDFPAHAAAALASLELSLPPLPSTTSSVYDAAIADAQIAAVEHDAPMAPPPSVAPPPRLGAAHFGALNLDFDLDLPPLAAQPSVALAPDELAAIARHKLNLAVESMKLGDAAGARALVSEVIASNDPTTLEKARALHAALAPL